VSSFIASRALSHRNNLISHLSAYDFSVQERLKQLTQYLSSGSGDVNKAQQQAYKILDLSVMKQSFILTYMDTFLYLGIFFLCCLPLVFLIRKTKAAKVDLSAAH
jgi:DHA2 family multidrug resistance protein